MKKCIAHLVNESPYSQSRHYTDDFPRGDKEAAHDHEVRTWRHRMHATKDGRVFIPGSQFAGAIKEAAKRLRMQIRGKGKSEYTKHFEAGVLVPDNYELPALVETVPCDKLYLNSDGVRGSGKRVTKFMPRIDEWEATVTYWIFDDIITEEVFLKALHASGQLVGIGRFRPAQCGYYGRFTVKSYQWVEDVGNAVAAE